MADEHEYPPTWPVRDQDAAEPKRSLGRRLLGAVGRSVLKGVGGALLVASGTGLPKRGEDRLWRLRHPDDDEVNPFWDQ